MFRSLCSSTKTLQSFNLPMSWLVSWHSFAGVKFLLCCSNNYEGSSKLFYALRKKDETELSSKKRYQQQNSSVEVQSSYCHLESQFDNKRYKSSSNVEDIISSTAGVNNNTYHRVIIQEPLETTKPSLDNDDRHAMV